MNMDFSDLQVGDEVATVNYDHLGVDRGPTVYQIVRRTDKTAWAQHNNYEIATAFREPVSKILDPQQFQSLARIQLYFHQKTVRSSAKIKAEFDEWMTRSVARWLRLGSTRRSFMKRSLLLGLVSVMLAGA
jgi:hypothetical protein